MLYSYKFCIPANTSKQTPYRESHTIRHDTILRVKVFTPPGHFGLTGLRIKWGIKQIVPEEPTEWIYGTYGWVESEVMFRLGERGAMITFEGYNEDEVYEHCFYICIEAVNWEEYAWWEKLEKSLQKLSEDVERLANVFAPRVKHERRHINIEEVINRLRKHLKV